MAKKTTLLNKEHIRPYNSVIKIGAASYEVAECLLKAINGWCLRSTYLDMIYDSVFVCETDLFLPLMLLTCGKTMFPELSTRIYKELSEIMTKQKYKRDASRVAKTGLTVHDPPRRKHAVFFGASFWRKTHRMHSGLASKNSLAENGAKVVGVRSFVYLLHNIKFQLD